MVLVFIVFGYSNMTTIVSGYSIGIVSIKFMVAFHGFCKTGYDKWNSSGIYCMYWPKTNRKSTRDGESKGFISWGVPKGKIHNIDHM